MRDFEELEKMKNMSPEELVTYVQEQYRAQRKPIIFGYARVSTKGQAKDGTSLEEQEQVLRDSGCQFIYKDVMSGVKMDRPELEKLLCEVQSGDMIVCTKLDRLSRSASEGIELISDLNSRGIKVNVLNLGLIDGKSHASVLITNIMLCFANYERDLIKERLSAGRAYRKAHDKNYKEGRPIKFSEEQRGLALDLLKTNSYQQVSRLTGIPVRTLARYKARAVQETN